MVSTVAIFFEIASLPFVSVESSSPRSDEYDITLTFKAGGIERSLGGRESLSLFIDPSHLNFQI